MLTQKDLDEIEELVKDVVKMDELMVVIKAVRTLLPFPNAPYIQLLACQKS